VSVWLSEEILEGYTNGFLACMALRGYVGRKDTQQTPQTPQQYHCDGKENIS
jgi:hypothetical protein